MHPAPAPRRIFISHSSADKDVAVRLAKTLRTNGFEVWLDAWTILAGESWQTAVRKALDAADAVVVLVSANQGLWTRFEWSEVVKRAWADRDLVVLPVLLDETDPPGFLRDLHAIRFDQDASQGIQDTLVALRHPRERGVQRTAAGEMRLQRRLAELEHAAASLAEVAERE